MRSFSKTVFFAPHGLLQAAGRVVFCAMVLCVMVPTGRADVISRPQWAQTTAPHFNTPTGPTTGPLQTPLRAHIAAGYPPLPVPRTHFHQPAAASSSPQQSAMADPPVPPQRPLAFASLAPSMQFQNRINHYVRPVSYVTMAERMGVPHPRPVVTYAKSEPKVLPPIVAAADEDDETTGEDHRIMHVPSLRKGYVIDGARTHRFTLMGIKPSWYAFDDSVITSCFPPLLRSALQQLADYFHRDVIVTSGFRDHGRAHSLHRSCQAADIMVDGITPMQLAHIASGIAGVNGIGTYRHVRITHIDVRDYKAAWRY